MEYIFISLSVFLAICGIVFSFSPIVPAIILSYGSILVLYFTEVYEVTLNSVILWGVVVAASCLIDFFVAPMITAKKGGSKKAVTGSFVGTLVGSIFFPPWGMIIGAYLGALIGEIIHAKELSGSQFRIAFWSFLGFLIGTGLKIVISITIFIQIIYYIIYN